MIWNFLADTYEFPSNLDTITSLRELPDPLSLPGMHVAVDRLERAIQDQESILIYGDYDMDGISGTAILVRALQHIGAIVGFYTPDRVKDGYGLRASSISAEPHCDVIITVDNGVSALAEVKKLPSDVIITDHHTIPSDFNSNPYPDNLIAVVHPGLPDTPEDVQGLCGAGVAWMLAYALFKQMKHVEGKPLLNHLLAYASLGTVADVVPLTGLNRFIVQQGLKHLAVFVGARALLQVANVRPPILASHIGFQIAPRCNAAGRIGDAFDATRLLVTDDASEASRLARRLDQYNITRRRMTTDALLEVTPHPVQVSATWAPGIAGVIAGRLTEERGQPSIVICVREGKGHGSCRAPEGFNILSALHKCADLLLKYGGHSRAAGLTVAEGNLEAFKERFGALVTEADIPPKTLTIAGRMPLSRLNERFMDQLAALEPFGEGNPEPIFVSQACVKMDQAVGHDRSHRQLDLEDGGRRLRAIWFKGVGKDLPKDLEVAYRPVWNHWNGRKYLNVQVIAVRASS